MVSIDRRLSLAVGVCQNRCILRVCSATVTDKLRACQVLLAAVAEHVIADKALAYAAGDEAFLMDGFQINQLAKV